MIARLRAPGLHRGILAIPLGIGLAYAIDLPIRAASHYHPVLDGTAILQISMIIGAVRLPDRPRRVRLLVLLGGRATNAPGGPLRPRRAHLEGLLPRSTPTTR